MITKETITVRKANKETIKTADGSFNGHEADISITQESDTMGEIKESDLIERAQQLVFNALKDGPAWIEQEHKKGENERI